MSSEPLISIPRLQYAMVLRDMPDQIDVVRAPGAKRGRSHVSLNLHFAILNILKFQIIFRDIIPIAENGQSGPWKA
jgi:hypothetical protein